MINWFIDFKREYQELKAEIDASYKKIMDTGIFVLGQEVLDFENEFAKFTNSEYCISVANGTDAIAIALKSLNLPASSGVLTTPLTATYTALAVNMAGLRPVFVDIDDSLNLNLKLYFPHQKGGLENKINPEIKAIVPVHLYGNPCDMDAIMSYCKTTNTALVEDCAQAHGAKYNGQTVGVFGDISAFSFYPTKNLGAYGDGGAIITGNEALYKKSKIIREGGQTAKYVHDFLGVNSRLDELQAGFLKVKLSYLEKWNKRRKEIANYYKKELLGVGDLTFPKVLQKSDPVFHIFAVLSKNRDRLADFLLQKQIKTAIHYPIPLHLQKCFSYLGYKMGDFPNAEKASQEVLTLPMHPYLADSEVEHVVTSIKEFEF